MAYVVAPNIEPYRKGQSFATWIRRLSFHFRVNKINDKQRKDQMFVLGGDYLFSVADKLYPTEAMMEEVSYEILIQKLKERLDKTDSVFLQRYSFSTKVQQPGESASDFVFSLKVLAEHCEVIRRISLFFLEILSKTQLEELELYYKRLYWMTVKIGRKKITLQFISGCCDVNPAVSEC